MGSGSRNQGGCALSQTSGSTLRPFASMSAGNKTFLCNHCTKPVKIENRTKGHYRWSRDRSFYDHVPHQAADNQQRTAVLEWWTSPVCWSSCLRLAKLHRLARSDIYQVHPEIHSESFLRFFVSGGENQHSVSRLHLPRTSTTWTSL